MTHCAKDMDPGIIPSDATARSEDARTIVWRLVIDVAGAEVRIGCVSTRSRANRDEGPGSRVG